MQVRSRSNGGSWPPRCSGRGFLVAAAERTFLVLDDAGVTVATAREFAWEDLVALLDRGGYARRNDFKTATRSIR